MNILLVEDHVVYREVLENLCATLPGQASVTSVMDGAAAIRHCQARAFSLLLIDLQLSDMDGFAVIEAAARTAPNIPIIAFTSQCDDYAVYRAEKAHVKGFVDKRVATTADLRVALTNVTANGFYFSPSFVQKKSERRMNPMSFDKILSDREMAVTELIAVPLSDREIAVELGISHQTVEKHRFNVLRKLGLKTLAELVRFARLHGIALVPGQASRHSAKPFPDSLRPAALAAAEAAAR